MAGTTKANNFTKKGFIIGAFLIILSIFLRIAIDILLTNFSLTWGKNINRI